MNIKNNNGSVLVIVLSFVLAFSLIGVGSIHHSYMQSEIAEKEKASSEAFWTADGLVERSMANLDVSLSNMLNLSSTEGRVNYTVTTTGNCICNPPPDPLPDDYKECCNKEDCTYINGVISDTQELCSSTNGQVSDLNRAINSIGTVTIPHSIGTNNIQIRRILAKFGSHNIENAITTHGTVNGSCVPAGSAEINGNCVANWDFSFETIFNGMTYDSTPDAADPLEPVRCPSTPDPNEDDFECIAENNGQNFVLTGPSELWSIFGLTVIHPIGNFNNPTFNTDNSAEWDGDPALLIVDMTDYTGNPDPKLNIAGNVPFCGIIWAIGEVKVEGTADVHGAIFVDGSPTGDTPFTGDALAEFNLDCVEDAIANFGGTGPPSGYVWKEY